MCRVLYVIHPTQFPFTQGKHFFSTSLKTWLLRILANFWTCCNFHLGDRTHMKIKVCCVHVYLSFRTRVGRSILAMWAKQWNSISSAAGVWFDAKELWEGHLTRCSAWLDGLILKCLSPLKTISSCRAGGAAVSQPTQDRAQKRARAQPRGVTIAWIAALTCHRAQFWGPTLNKQPLAHQRPPPRSPKRKHTSRALGLPECPSLDQAQGRETPLPMGSGCR